MGRAPSAKYVSLPLTPATSLTLITPLTPTLTSTSHQDVFGDLAVFRRTRSSTTDSPGHLAIFDRLTSYTCNQRFALELNEVTGVELGRLPPTDARLRPDQRSAPLPGLPAHLPGLPAPLPGLPAPLLALPAPSPLPELWKREEWLRLRISS